MLVEVLFYIFGTILVLAALGVIVSRNPVYSALSLVLCFVTSAAICSALSQASGLVTRSDLPSQANEN